MSDAFRSDELFACHIPAIELLVNLGYQYLDPAQLRQARGGRADQVVLEEVLRQQLPRLNRIQYRERSHPFSEANIATAIDTLQGVPFMGLLASNVRVYELLTLGVNLTQTLAGDTKNFTLRYIDWEQPHNNVFHVTSDFMLEPWRNADTLAVDLLLFVNGIPFVAIACAAPQAPLQQAQSGLLRQQDDANLVKVLMFAQLLIALNGKDARYASVGTRLPHWARWCEELQIDTLRQIRQQPLALELRATLFDLAQTRLGHGYRTGQERELYQVPYAMTPQDQTLYAMCRPERLLDLVRNATLFDGGQRKLARYHQYFAVEKALQRLRQPLVDGKRPGGLILHAEGSGKSLTMIFLARKLALAPDWLHPKIVLISSRADLGGQLEETFSGCRMHPLRAKSGRNLLESIAEDKPQLILSLPHRIARSSGFKKNRDESSDIFLLVEEDHQQALGEYAGILRNMFPNACYIGFSGTPANSEDGVWPLIDVYSAQQAQQDELLVPLVYESRDSASPGEPEWLARQTADWAPEARDSMQKSAAKAYKLAAAEHRMLHIALDISLHFRNIYHGSGLKGQLVAPDHHSALRYKAIFDQLGVLDSALLLSGKSIAGDITLKPLAAGQRMDSADKPDLAAFGMQASELLQTLWHNTIASFGNEDAYHRQIIQQFISSDKPELLIVVDQLLDALHAPHTGVLYLVRTLSGHTLLQVLARVNRAATDCAKPFGLVIDYAGNLAPAAAEGRLDDIASPLSNCPALAGFEENELQASIKSAQPAIIALPVCHADCWSLFKISHRRDRQDQFEHELCQPVLRSEFHLRLERFAETLNLALGHARFLRQCTPEVLQEYRADALRFLQLKLALQLRYAENVGMSAAEAMLWRKLHRVPCALPQVNLLEPLQFQQILDEFGFASAHAQADSIAHHLLRYLAERQWADPLLRELQQQVIQIMHEFEVHRMDANAYLAQIRDCYARLLQPAGTAQGGNILQADGLTLALISLILPLLRPDADAAQKNAWAAAAAQAFIASLQSAGKTPHLDDSDQIKQIGNQIDDYLCDVMEKQGQITLSSDEKDALIDQVLLLARQRGAR